MKGIIITRSSRVSRLAIITSQAFSINNFRGPLIREMISRGITVYAFAPDYDDITKAEVLSLGAVPIEYSMSRAGMNPLRDIFDLFRLSLKLYHLKLDMSFSYFIKPVIYGTLAARVAGISKRVAMIEGAGYIFTDDNRLSNARRFLRTVVTWLYKFGLTQADLVFILNPDDKKLFIDNGMVTAEKVQLLNGIGLDLSHYKAVPFTCQSLCFVFVARFLREKGIYEYINAARQVKARYPDVRFLILGNVDLNPSSVAESEVVEWVKEGTVEWPGHVSDVRPWIAEASVFVLPSYREGLPRSTQEAMAMGRPVITTDVPGCRETVKEGINGFLIPVRDPDALIRAMLNFIEQPIWVEQMGAESRRIAEEKFDVHKINGLILSSMKL